MGTGVAALRQVPCNCNACDEKIRLPWVDGVVDAKDQPRFGKCDDCFLNLILEDSNCWHIVELVLKKGTEEDVDEAHEEVLHHVTSAVAQSVVVGAIGAIATADDEAPDGYYLVEFTSEPYTDQDDGVLKCDSNWLYPLPQARKWFTKSVEGTSVELLNVVSAGVTMLPISPGNMAPNRRQKEAKANGALKISEDSHNFILDEMVRRDRLEYDPMRVYAGEEEEDEIENDSEK